ncbi:hypothetical protein JQM68_07820 [Oscillibacter valericigenes]|uniref:hypothetical protein n=1 Tax=Oscillibacter valericigenes TaxID=351091 RepID=UPI001F1FAA4B|nr:hypothetical protein [Oscillibacter valericigenes]MCF2617106.1 hypothetical protein [Oscillibacter valericigenes]
MKSRVVTWIGIAAAVILLLLLFSDLGPVQSILNLLPFAVLTALLIYNLVKLDRVEKKLDKLLEEKESQK